MFTIRDGTLTVEGEPTSTEWLQFGHELRNQYRSLQFLIGDWLLYGEGRPEWGNIYREAEALFDVPANTLAQWKRVSKAFPSVARDGEPGPCKRLQDLSWSHHQAAASAPIEQREPILREAQSKRLSVRATKELVSAFLAYDDNEEAEPDFYPCVMFYRTAEMTLSDYT